MLILYFAVLFVCGVLGFLQFVQTRKTVNLTIEMFRQTHGKMLEDSRVVQFVYKSTYGVYDRKPIWSYSNFVALCLLLIVFVPVTIAALLFMVFGNESVFAVAVVSVAIISFFIFMSKCDNTPSNLYITSFMDGVIKIKEYDIVREHKGI